ncbi:hemolysin family protein [Microbacterium excoecariae]|uniref:hemolysin family protein n=1 Tax=Microbacterium excoecariae TaxID=2715210 RepID=UPI00140A143E|nr:hemolysin family protein [Microbacterium excoecariae]NHI17037.1 HlyC/CorC family transporter [Microbacterium excoecariae]
MIEILLLVGALLLLVVAGFMAALDSALSVTSTADLVDLASEGRSARSLAHLARDRDPHDNAVTFVRVLSEVGAVVLLAASFSLMFESALWGTIVTVVVSAAIIYLVVASAPTTVGRRYARPLLTAGAPTIHAARVVLGPIARPLAGVSARLIPGARRRGFESEEQFLSIVDEAASNALIEDDDRELIHSVFDFTDQIVRALMVPRTEMVTVEGSASASEAIDAFLSSGLSRLPVIDGDVDNVVGVLYLKDLVQHAFRDTPGWRRSAVRAFARPAAFVPEQMRAETLLQQMKADKVHVCLVVDEYGGIAGLVTLEDLLEELVGEIADEYDPRSNEIVELADGSYRVSAGLGQGEVGDLFGVEIDDEDVDSIGGLMAKALGRMPQPGEQVEVEGLVLTGGTSRGRGRGIATVFVERSAALLAVDEVLGRTPRTGEVPAVEASERAPRTGSVRVSPQRQANDAPESPGKKGRNR